MDWVTIYTAVVLTLIGVLVPFIFLRVKKAWYRHLNRIDHIDFKLSAVNKGAEEAFDDVTLDKGRIYKDERDKHYDYLVEKDKQINKDR